MHVKVELVDDGAAQTSRSAQTSRYGTENNSLRGRAREPARGVHVWTENEGTKIHDPVHPIVVIPDVILLELTPERREELLESYALFDVYGQEPHEGRMVTVTVMQGFLPC